MPCMQYQNTTFRSETKAIIAKANAIVEEYAAQGYDLTLRQLYYQFVARGLIENKDTEYKRLGSIINDARLAGEMDWSRLVDRTRNLAGNSHWGTPAEMVESAYRSYRIDKWEDQPSHIEIWVEKEALAGIVERAARALDVSYFSCRGYVSQSEMWAAGRRLKAKVEEENKSVSIIHLGDHDPSGIDMTRDILDRLTLFMGDGWSYTYDEPMCPNEVYVNRIALNMDQVKQYNPPPNPAKITDSRAADYMQKHGGQSWELDALDPTILNSLITQAVLKHRDEDLWEKMVEREQRERAALRTVSQKWDEVSSFLELDYTDTDLEEEE